MNIREKSERSQFAKMNLCEISEKSPFAKINPGEKKTKNKNDNLSYIDAMIQGSVQFLEVDSQNISKATKYASEFGNERNSGMKKS